MESMTMTSYVEEGDERNIMKKHKKMKRKEEKL